MLTTAPTEDHIRSVAYALWLQEGRPEGRAEAHWLRARELVNAEAHSAVSATPKRAAAAVKKPAPRKKS